MRFMTRKFVIVFLALVALVVVLGINHGAGAGWLGSGLGSIAHFVLVVPAW